jgi:hypothetical protein
MFFPNGFKYSCILFSGLFISIALLTASCDGFASGRTSSSSSGRCQVPSDTAADGSRCGNRAASTR